MSLYKELGRPARDREEESPYSFSGTQERSNPERGKFRVRSAETRERSSSSRRASHDTTRRHRTRESRHPSDRREDFDRPRAGNTDRFDRPPAHPKPTHHGANVQNTQEWHAPTVKHVLIDLSLRCVEVAIPAVIGAIASEIGYYFKYRRFYPTESVHYHHPEPPSRRQR